MTSPIGSCFQNWPIGHATKVVSGPWTRFIASPGKRDLSEWRSMGPICSTIVQTMMVNAVSSAPTAKPAKICNLQLPDPAIGRLTQGPLTLG